MNQVPREFIEQQAIARGVPGTALEALLPALDGEPAENTAKNLNIQLVAYRKRLGEVYKRFGIEGKGQGKLIQLKQQLLTAYEAQKATSTHARDELAPLLEEDVDDCTVDVSAMHERTEEVEHLERWIIEDKIRLLTLFGEGGIGKTSLAAKIYERIQERQDSEYKFEQVVWRSLQAAPTLSGLLDYLLKRLCSFESTSPSEMTDDIDAKITSLINCLNRERCLIILDDVQAILAEKVLVGTYIEGYEKFGEFLKKIGERPHRSCLILISREKPKEVIPLEGEKSLIRAFEVEGLNSLDSKSLLKIKGLHASEEDLNQLIRIYSGNPLILKVASTAIDDLFDSQVSSFLEQGVLVFGDIQTLLEEQFARLTPLEQDIMYWLAINGEPVSASDLEKDILSFNSKIDLLEALSSLRWRSLIERQGGKFTQIPVIYEYMIQRLVDCVFKGLTEENNLTKEDGFGYLSSYALTKATSKDTFRAKQEKQILKPISNRLENFFLVKSKIVSRFKEILEHYDKSPSTGYLVGNLFNLCGELGIPLSEIKPDKKFVGWTIWQANLVNTQLQEFSFENADLRGSVFAEHVASLVSVVFIAEGRFFATGSNNGEIRLWRVADSKQMQLYTSHDGRPVWSLDYLSASSGLPPMLISGGEDCTVQLRKIDLEQLENLDAGSERSEPALQPIFLRGHTEGVKAVTVSPDGRLIASGSKDKTARLWDVKTLECIRPLEHQEAVLSVTFSPDGRWLACASAQTVKLWEVDGDAALELPLEHTGAVLSVRFSSDGRFLASSGEDKKICIWDCVQARLHAVLKGHHQKIYSVRFHPLVSHKLASGSADATIRLWDLTQESDPCTHILQEHRSQVWSLTFSPDGTSLLSGSDDQTARLWQTENGKLLNTLQGYTRGVYSVAFSPDGRLLASGDDQDLRLWSVQEKRLLYSWQGHRGRVRSVAFNPQPQFEEYVLASGGSDMLLKQWRIDGVYPREFPLVESCHTNWISQIAYSSDGKQMASASEDYTVSHRRLQTEDSPKCIDHHTGCVWSVAFSPDGNLLASGSADKTIRIWDTERREEVRVLAVEPETAGKAVLSVAFAPVTLSQLREEFNGTTDHWLLASGTADKRILLWDATKGTQIDTLVGHEGPVFALAFSPDGAFLASGSADCTVRLWDVRSGELHKEKRLHNGPVRAIAFSPDGTLLASGSEDETIQLWQWQQDEAVPLNSDDRLYKGMDVRGAKGLSEAQKLSLRDLGAITEDPLPV